MIFWDENMNVPFFPPSPICLWKNFKMAEFSRKWWSCFPLSWGSEWEISGLFLVWFPGVAGAACDPVHRLDAVVFILPGTIFSLWVIPQSSWQVLCGSQASWQVSIPVLSRVHRVQRQQERGQQW